MHHPANSTTEQCHFGEHDNAGGESIPMYHSSGGGGGTELVEAGGVWICLYARGWINLDYLYNVSVLREFLAFQ